MKKLSVSQIAVSNFPYGKYTFGYALDSLERMGGENLELYACDPHFHVDDMTASDLAAAKKQIKDHHLRVVCITPEQCIYPVNIANKNVTARKRSLQTYVRCLEAANEMECSLCQFLSGFGCLAEKHEDVWKRSEESLEHLPRIAEAYGVDIALETSPKSDTCLTNASEVMEMIHQVGSDRLHGMMDTAVLGYSGESAEDVIRTLGKDLRHIHFADGVPNGHLILGEGELDLRHMLQCINDCGYEYALSLEIMNNKYVEDPDHAMKTSFEWLKREIGKLQ